MSTNPKHRSEIELQNGQIGFEIHFNRHHEILFINLPQYGCRERCLFCNQKAATEGLPSPSSVQNLLKPLLLEFPYDKKNREKQVAFYGGSFTAIR